MDLSAANHRVDVLPASLHSGDKAGPLHEIRVPDLQPIPFETSPLTSVATVWQPTGLAQRNIQSSPIGPATCVTHPV